VKYLTVYHGNINLREYLKNHTLTIKQTYSIMLQIIKILMILYKRCYSHNDLHTGNIMIKRTNLSDFELNKSCKKLFFHNKY